MRPLLLLFYFCFSLICYSQKDSIVVVHHPKPMYLLTYDNHKLVGVSLFKGTRIVPVNSSNNWRLSIRPRKGFSKLIFIGNHPNEDLWELFYRALEDQDERVNQYNDSP